VGDAVDAEGRLAVGRLATTRMACPGPLAAFEQQFFGLIEAEPVLRYEGDVLLLIDGKKQARFRRADSAPGVRP
jgi:heat shock protein HslJ